MPGGGDYPTPMPMPPDQGGPTPPTSPTPPVTTLPVGPGPFPPRPGAPQPWQPPQGPTTMPVPGLPGSGLSDIPRNQLLMQMMLARRAAQAGGRPPNPYGPGRDYAGYPTPPPGMAGPV